MQINYTKLTAMSFILSCYHLAQANNEALKPSAKHNIDIDMTSKVLYLPISHSVVKFTYFGIWRRACRFGKN